MVLVGIAGRHTPAGLVLRHGDGFRVVTPDSTPVVVVAGAQALTPLGLAVLAALDAEPCPVCSRYACDCDEWHEMMAGIDADPHALNDLSNLDIPL